MAAPARLTVTPELVDNHSSISALTDLSLDELRFLRSCNKRWFELTPAKASAIIRAARSLIVELTGEIAEGSRPAAHDASSAAGCIAEVRERHLSR